MPNFSNGTAQDSADAKEDHGTQAHSRQQQQQQLPHVVSSNSTLLLAPLSSRSDSASSLPLLDQRRADRSTRTTTTTSPLPIGDDDDDDQRGGGRTRERHSIWECETTPMTTRPHFERRFDEDEPLLSSSSAERVRTRQRIRSRSLGSAAERQQQQQQHPHPHHAFGLDHDAAPPLLLPLLDWDVYDLRVAPPQRRKSSGLMPLKQHLDTSPTIADAAAVVLEKPPSPSSPLAETISRVSFDDETTPLKDRYAEEALEVEDDLIQQAKPEKATTVDDDDNQELPAWINVLYGMINATIVLPVLMSFASIIYRDDAFAPYIPVLVKLTIMSGMVHQLCFSTFSSLPFAVGQVQDAGLIFLSSMASDMVRYCRMRGHDDETLLATVTVGLALATACLGCGLVAIGYLNLGQYVQLLPTCVVGGYLAYIGWFCGEAGVGIMAGSSKLTFDVVSSNIEYILPGVLGGIIIYLTVTQVRHVAALPLCILLELLLFYFVLWVTNTTVQDATEGGWIRQMDQPPPWYRTWDYLRPAKVDWAVIPNLALTELGMIFVVALSSCLDVAAIEIELNRPLNYNHELKTVGLSNIISGMTGGYTGSYIFSQSIFSLRAGIRSRLVGYVIALCQIIVVVLPIPVLTYVPNFFFGSLLSMICVDLVYEWLWDVRLKLTKTEYGICLATFGLIHALSVEYGILAGVALHWVCKRLGFNVGVAKFSTHDEETRTSSMESDEDPTNELLLMEEVDDDDDDDSDSDSNKPKLETRYGTLPSISC